MRLYMEYTKLRKIRKSRKSILFIIIGIVLIIISISIFIIRYFYYTKLNEKEEKQIDNFFNQTTVTENTNDIDDTSVDDSKTAVNYIAVLEIPTINLKRGLVDKSDSSNNVNSNIYMLEDTILPDENEISHIILAAHNGNSYVSFFKDLHKLDINDEIYFYYKNNKYVYSIYKIYEVDKTGNISLDKSLNSDITLITCKGNLKKQIVVSATLKSKETY